MFCPYCGNACADTHKFCFHCGKQLPDLSVLNLPVEEITEAPIVTESLEEPEINAEPTSIEAHPEVTEESEECSLQEGEPAAEDTEPAETTVEHGIPDPVPVTPAPKKGRLWPPLALLVILACIGLGVFLSKGSPVPDPNACFSVENGTLFFDYSLYTGSDELTIPESVNGITVTTISDGCFADCDGLTTVIIPSTIKKIGTNAFSGCDALRGIYIPDGVTAIGAGAFSGCTSLEAVYFPSSTLAVGAGCLDNCNALRFLFYHGTYERWLELYNGTYPANMELHTLDGVYYARP